MKSWYFNSDASGQWVDCGSHKFRVSKVAGRKSLDMDGFCEEIGGLFAIHSLPYTIDDIKARHEKQGTPFSRLNITPVKS